MGAGQQWGLAERRCVARTYSASRRDERLSGGRQGGHACVHVVCVVYEVASQVRRMVVYPYIKWTPVP